MNSNINLICKADSLSSKGKDYYITGLASNTNIDLQGETVTAKALESMKAQAVGLNLLLEHQHSFNSIIGVITEAELTKSYDLYITARILPDFVKEIEDRLSNGINLGFSIGGFAEYSADKVIEDFKLLEVSLVALPANWESFSTVYHDTSKSVECKCLLSGITTLQKHLEESNMETKDIEIKETIESVDVVESADEAAVIKEAEIEAAPVEDVKDIDTKAEDEEEAEKPVTASEVVDMIESILAEKIEQIRAEAASAAEEKAVDEDESTEEEEPADKPADETDEDEKACGKPEDKAEDSEEEKAVEPEEKAAEPEEVKDAEAEEEVEEKAIEVAPSKLDAAIETAAIDATKSFYELSGRDPITGRKL